MHAPTEVADWIKETRVSPSAACASIWCGREPGVWEIGAEIGGDVDLFFDLASLTKPIVACAILRSKLDVRAATGAYVEESRGTGTEEVPIELLLAHRAGLAATAPLYLPLVHGHPIDEREALASAASARRASPRLPKDEGWEPLYSDLGYILAGVALARFVGARDAGDAARALVLDPLGVSDVGSARDLEARGIDLAARAAPTEDVPWRGGLVRGLVHDECAWALTGTGASGHAGLFGTIGGVVEIVKHFMTSDLGFMTRERPGGTLRAGFDGKSATGSSAGSLLGPRTFGHLGFTGTSFWIDPDARVAVVLLTNRVCPTRANDAIRAARPRAHDALARYALERRGRR